MMPSVSLLRQKGHCFQNPDRVARNSLKRQKNKPTPGVQESCTPSVRLGKGPQVSNKLSPAQYSQHCLAYLSGVKNTSTHHQV